MGETPILWTAIFLIAEVSLSILMSRILFIYPTLIIEAPNRRFFVLTP